MESPVAKKGTLWIQPEMKQLSTAFNKLRKLTLRGIFVEFDIIWTLAFLEAAPTMEILLIEVWDHACSAFVNDEERRSVFAERKNPQWEMDFHCSKNGLLKELQFVGFRSLEQQFVFIRALLGRAPNLQTILLKGAEQCKYCNALDTKSCCSTESSFPKSEDEQAMVARRITDGKSSPRVIFHE
uniref:At1g61320/AtMIF1 LRR domain-containing protein n=1 Tax=Aegilops tauschii subsp. strangulata TaxID=200361 RepID=A0A453MFY1_AEGTS